MGTEKIASTDKYTVDIRVRTLAERISYLHRMMNIPEFWSETRGSDVTVAVLDTGISPHKDLDYRVRKDFTDSPSGAADRAGHSSHVGGIVAAIAGNGIGVAGIAPECDDVYGKVLGDDGTGGVDSIVKGIHWAVDDMGAKVINCSLGIPPKFAPIRSLEKACDYARDNGTAVVCAAGNDAGAVNLPAAFDSTIAVAAVDSSKKHADFSSSDNNVDFAVGGVEVYSTYKDNTYAELSGTSMAAPGLSGVAALIQSYYYKLNGKYLSVDELYDHIKEIAFDAGPRGYDKLTGHGIPIFDTEFVNEIKE